VVQVIIPELNSSEVIYTINCLLGDFLGLEYCIKKDKGAQDFALVVENKKIRINNVFFRELDHKKLYTINRLPKHVCNDTISGNGKEFPITSLYGDCSVKIAENEYFLECDIVGSTFFMLTRWEEEIVPKKDKHERFQAIDSIAYKFGFLDRPIVNEYVELVWLLLRKIGYLGHRKIRKFITIPTHDIDMPLYFMNKNLFAIVKKSLTKKGLTRNALYKYIISNKDPWDTYGKFMSLSEDVGVKSHFFFMATRPGKFDPGYSVISNTVKKIMCSILARGHIVGFHPSYNSYSDLDLFQCEKESLERAAEARVICGRQHYLRFQNSVTWDIWDSSDMTWDSTMSYADVSGFRCGVCYDFPVFNYKRRKTLKLREKPLIVMDATLRNYEKLTLTQSKEKVISLKNQVRKYNGEFVFLWHNSSFNVKRWYEWEEVLLTMYRS
jgi:hypothetical protein